MPDLRSKLCAALSSRHRVWRTKQFRTHVTPLPKSGSGVIAGPTLTCGCFWKHQMLPH